MKENMMSEVSEEKMEKKQKRGKWEIEEDLRAFQTVRKVLKDKERLEEVKELAKEKIDETKGTESLVDGDMQEALGLS